MLLKRRIPKLAQQSALPAKGFEHLLAHDLATLAWLRANGVEFVLVGPVAEAIRGETVSSGPPAIVPAPYGRNYDRLARALTREHARLREPGVRDGGPEAKLSGELLAEGRRWLLRCGEHELDVEPQLPDGPRFQELLYEAARFEPAPGLKLEVAGPEDLTHYAYARATGTSPQIRISRGERAQQVSH